MTNNGTLKHATKRDDQKSLTKNDVVILLNLEDFCVEPGQILCA